VECSQPGDMFTQMRGVLSLQRMAAHERMFAGAAIPALLKTRDVLKFATLNGAAANGLQHRIGSLRPGKQADIVLLRADAINVMPLNNAYGAIVLGMDTSNVDTVIVAGRLLKRHGALIGVDLARLQRDLADSRRHVFGRTSYDLSPTAPTICGQHSYAALGKPILAKT
jgi:5-methylthioadenosine/S-adenosylhomocysteine deaminase